MSNTDEATPGWLSRHAWIFLVVLFVLGVGSFVAFVVYACAHAPEVVPLESESAVHDNPEPTKD